MVEISAFSGRAPRAVATALVAGKVPVSTTPPFWITEAVEVKKDCCNDGARKAVETVVPTETGIAIPVVALKYTQPSPNEGCRPRTRATS